MRQDEFAQAAPPADAPHGQEAIAILPAAPVRMRNNDVEYHYRPDSDFYYLTAFAEPEAVAVLIPGRPQGEYVLFVRDRDPAREAWDGARAGPDGAVHDYGADDAFPIGDIDEILPGLLERRSRVFYTMGAHPEFDKRVIGWVNQLRSQGKHGMHTPHEFVALDHPLHEMRLTKSRAELVSMRRSAQIACAAHRRAAAAAQPGRMEYEVMAEILHEFHRRRADISYYPIVGSGPNACVLHYRENSRQMQDGELLLIDAGCEYDYYASDVTRTLPGRRPLQPQAAGGLRSGAGGAAGRDREGSRRGALERAARGGGARHHAGPRAPRPAEGPRAETDQGRRLPPFLHAPRRALARHGRARRRRVQGRRAVAAAGAGHGHHHRARDLHRPGLQGRAARMVGHRRAHRGRRRRHRRQAGSPDRRHADRSRRDRAR